MQTPETSRKGGVDMSGVRIWRWGDVTGRATGEGTGSWSCNEVRDGVVKIFNGRED